MKAKDIMFRSVLTGLVIGGAGVISQEIVNKTYERGKIEDKKELNINQPYFQIGYHYYVDRGHTAETTSKMVTSEELAEMKSNRYIQIDYIR